MKIRRNGYWLLHRKINEGFFRFKKIGTPYYYGKGKLLNSNSLTIFKQESITLSEVIVKFVRYTVTYILHDITYLLENANSSPVIKKEAQIRS